MQVVRAAAVVEVLPAERTESERVGVMYDGIVRVHHRVAGFAPPIADVAVLRRGERERRVESAEGAERARGEGEVGGDEEAARSLAHVVVLVQELDQELARGRVEAIAENVLDAA